MKNFSTWLLACFMVMYWVFRIMVALMAQLHQDFFIVPINETMEIVLLFVVLVCLVLVVKRKIVGALIYLLAYGMYFGTDIMTKITTLIDGSSQLGLNDYTALIISLTSQLGLNDYTALIISLIGIILPIAVLLDLLADKNRKAHPKDKKTDWFYKNEAYDRKLDDRADKNNYRTL